MQLKPTKIPQSARMSSPQTSQATNHQNESQPNKKMKTPNPDHPIRTTFARLALASTMGAAMYFGAAPANAAPPVTTGLKLHLDASALTGLNDGDTVTTWTDVSGTVPANSTVSYGGTPIYKVGVLNGQPVVRFDNASSFTTADLSLQFPSAATVFVVTTINNDNQYTLVKANPNVDEWWRYDNGNSYPAVFRGNRLEGYCTMPMSGSHLFAITSSASAWEMSINGTSKGVADGNFNAGGALMIGNHTQSDRALNGDIAEILIYDSVLSASDADLVGAYLAGKYGLTTNYGLPPTVSGYTPSVNGTTVPASNLVLTFSEPIAIGTGNITIRNTDSSPDPDVVIDVTDTNQVSISGAALTINPTSDLVLDKNYAVLIDAGAIKDLSEVPFAGILDVTWNFTIVAPVAPPPSPPVTSGMIVWLPADGVNANDSTEVRFAGSDAFVKQWKDLSGNANNANQTTEGDQPMYIASGLGGKPVVRFNGGSSKMTLADLSSSFPTAACIFAVIMPNNDNMYSAFGNRNNDERWMGGDWSEVTPGAFRGGRADFSGSYSLMPTTGSHIFAYESDSSAYKFLLNGNLIGTASADYNSGSGQTWGIGYNGIGNGAELNGDIAELILYNRVLTADEADLVGGYLTVKYGLTTSYPPPVQDGIAPTLVSIGDDKSGGTILTYEPVTYTVTFNEPMRARTVNIEDFENDPSLSSPAPVTINSVVATVNPAVYQVSVTATGAGSLRLQIKQNATLADYSGTPMNTASALPDDTTLTVNLDDVSPSLVSIDDNVSGGPITATKFNTPTYTVTFSETINPATVTADDFGNDPTLTSPAPITINSVTATGNPAVFQVVVTTSGPGDLRLQIKQGAEIKDLAGNALDTDPALNDGTTITVDPVPTFDCQLGVLDVVNANGGINPATGQAWKAGDTYRLVFVTSGTTTCDSTDIATYNNFVQGLAAASTSYPNLGSGNWKAVGSTATVAARDNTSTNPSANGVGEPIVRMDGLFVIANNYADLWNGDINFTHVPGQNYLAVHLDENGVERIDERVRTGSNSSGTASEPLGNSPNVQTGRNYTPDFYNGYGGWMADWGAAAADPGRVYAMSGVLSLQKAGGGFAAWAAANAPGQTAEQDHDNDGVENGIEYFMGETGSSFTPMPGLDGDNKVSWPASAAYVGTYEVQTSTDLATWTNVDPRPAPSGGLLEYTLPPGALGGKSFVRLLVTPAP
jgi:hypothetical protein